jgi:hypothetical protein
MFDRMRQDLRDIYNGIVSGIRPCCILHYMRCPGMSVCKTLDGPFNYHPCRYHAKRAPYRIFIHSFRSWFNQSEHLMALSKRANESAHALYYIEHGDLRIRYNSADDGPEVDAINCERINAFLDRY